MRLLCKVMYKSLCLAIVLPPLSGFCLISASVPTCTLTICTCAVVQFCTTENEDFVWLHVFVRLLGTSCVKMGLFPNWCGYIWRVDKCDSVPKLCQRCVCGCHIVAEVKS